MIRDPAAPAQNEKEFWVSNFRKSPLRCEQSLAKYDECAGRRGDDRVTGTFAVVRRACVGIPW